MPQPNIKNFYLPTTRVHVTEGYRWGQAAGTDYWLNWNSGFDTMAAASTATGEQLTENGWVATSLVNTNGSSGDFRGGVFTKATVPGPKTGNFGGTYGDAGIPPHALSNASGDLLASPSIFGSISHMEQAAILAGKNVLPRYLICDFWGSMSVASAAEVRSSWGFYNVAVVDTTVEATQLAVIQSGGTGNNFLLAGAAATMAQLGSVATISTTWHKWKIVLEFVGATGAKCWAYIDGALQNTTPGIAAQDVFPCVFGFGALTTNRPLLGPSHVYYDW